MVKEPFGEGPVIAPLPCTTLSTRRLLFGVGTVAINDVNGTSVGNAQEALAEGEEVTVTVVGRATDVGGELAFAVAAKTVALVMVAVCPSPPNMSSSLLTNSFPAWHSMTSEMDESSPSPTRTNSDVVVTV